jgi:outer membrane protein OmpA-like peptidoglycan-associated protein
MADQLRKSCHVELSGIYFNTGSARLLEESRPALKAIAQVVVQSKEPVLTVEGHTDIVGTAEFNQALSEKRAAAVREALVSQFAVPPGRLVTKGFGFTRPLESNDTVEGRARNRRVELACAGAH